MLFKRTAVSSVDTRGHQLSERASRSLTRHFAQVMSLSANGRVWSWCFAVLEWVSEGRGGEEDVFTNVWGEANRETVRTTRGSEKMMQSLVNWILKPKLRPDSPRSFSWEMGSSEFATYSTKLKKRKPHKMSRKETFLGATHRFFLLLPNSPLHVTSVLACCLVWSLESESHLL